VSRSTGRGCCAVIVQARMGSTRLPGKVLMTLGGRTVLEHVLRRCLAIAEADTVVCATTDRAADDAVATEAERLGAAVFRGDEADVLGRYLGAAREAGVDEILRVTSDCPLIDPELCGAVIALRRAEGVDYAANNMPPTWPHGLDCEAFTTAALARADAEAGAPADREHVTPWLRRAEDVRRANLPVPGEPRPDYRWTLDTPEDYEALVRLFERLDDPTALPGWREVMALVDATPELASLRRPRDDAAGTNSIEGRAVS